jgi:hypothetical protein
LLGQKQISISSRINCGLQLNIKINGELIDLVINCGLQLSIKINYELMDLVIKCVTAFSQWLRLCFYVQISSVLIRERGNPYR